MRASALVVACASLISVTACTRVDPVSVLVVSTSVTPTVASVSRDTLGVQVTIEVRNPLNRSVRVVTRPGRFMAQGNSEGMGGEDAARSWGLGFGIRTIPTDSSSVAGGFRFGRAPVGKTLTFEPHQALSYTFRLAFRPDRSAGRADLEPGRFVLVGSWNTVEGPAVDIEVVP